MEASQTLAPGVASNQEYRAADDKIHLHYKRADGSEIDRLFPDSKDAQEHALRDGQDVVNLLDQPRSEEMGTLT